jgi:type IV secretion system protein VirB9
MIRMVMRAVPLALLTLSACAGQYHPPAIRYDDAVQGVRLSGPAEARSGGRSPEATSPAGPAQAASALTTYPCRAPRSADPAARVTQANLAARIQPTRAGLRECGAGLSLFSGRPLSGLCFARRDHRRYAPAG